MEFITLNPDNVMSEHLCCAISDKKHQTGVNDKRNWLSERVKEGHVFRKLARYLSSMPRWKRRGCL